MFFLSRECSHPKADYAWSSVAEATFLGPAAANGILMLCRSSGPKSIIKGTQVMSCVADLDIRGLIAHLAPAESAQEATCQTVFNNLKDLLDTGAIEETEKLRFIVGFGSRYWYGNDCK